MNKNLLESITNNPMSQLNFFVFNVSMQTFRYVIFHAACLQAIPRGHCVISVVDAGHWPPVFPRTDYSSAKDAFHSASDGERGCPVYA